MPLTLSSTQQIQELYIAYFGRAADPEGLNYWYTVVTNHTNNLNNAANQFANSAEAHALYPFLSYPAVSNKEAFINSVYMNLFDRTAEAGGLAYWTGVLTVYADGTSNAGDVIKGIATGAQGSDITTITNKITVAQYYSDACLNSGHVYSGSESAGFIDMVDATTSSVTSTEYLIDHPGQEFNISVNDPSITEGQSGTKLMTFTVQLDHAPSETITVNYETVNSGTGAGTAAANTDFSPAAGTITFAAGQTVATVSVVVNGDTVLESNETIKLKLSGASLINGPVTGTGTIVNDDYNISVVTDNNLATNTIAESAVVGTVVGITAHASDATEGSTITYSLSSNPGGKFAIDEHTGIVTVNGPLDFETASSHTITVLATSSAGTVSSESFTINVTNVNDNPVTAIEDTNIAANSVAENAVAGTAVGITAHASDADQGGLGIVYTLSDNAGGRFAIDYSTGVVTVLSGIDYEAATSHNITVVATSLDGSTNSQSYTIAVTNVNDNPIYTISDANLAAANSVAENATVGTIVGITAHATDADAGATITYSLSDNASGRFVIDAETGVVSVAGPLDYETAPSHNITVVATSSDGSTYSQVFNIPVTNVNEAPTASPVLITATEDGSSISGNLLTAGAVHDVDAATTFTFSQLSGAAGFSLASNGVWTFSPASAEYQSLKLGEVRNIEVSYQVADNGSPALTATNTITLTVTGTNDIPVTSNVTVGGYENVVVHGQVTGVDVDGDTLTYAATNAVHGTVSMNAATGEYTFTPDADYWGTGASAASFDYTAFDGIGNSVVKTVTINLQDVANILTPDQDHITLANPGAENVLGTNNNLNAGDSITGGVEDTVFLSTDHAQAEAGYAGFILNGVGTFKVDNDSGSANTFDMSSSSGVHTLVSENSLNDVRFNYANTYDVAGVKNVNLDVINLTDGVNVTLDLRNGDVLASNDVANIHVTNSSDDSVSANSINITAQGTGAVDQNTAAGIETVNLTTSGSNGAVQIQDLNTPGATQLNITTAVNLTIGNTSGGFPPFENPISASISNVDARTSTGNVSLSTESRLDSVTIHGGDGNDTFVTNVGNYSDSVDGGKGDDTLWVGGGHNNVTGGEGNDNIWALGGNDNIDGGSGNDNIDAGNGNNTVYGRAGDDHITVGTGNDYVEGNEDNDTINISADGNDTVLAGSGNDTINVGSSLSSSYTENYTFHTEDQIDGGDGSDVLNLTGDSKDANDLDSVKNVETINLTGAGSYDISVTDGSWFDTDTKTSTTIDARNLSGSANLIFNGNDNGAHLADPPNPNQTDLGTFDDGVLSRAVTIYGSNHSDSINTGLGNDLIVAGSGNDTISTGSGNDRVDHVAGNDNISLGDGNDTVYAWGSELNGSDTIAGGNGTDAIHLELVGDGYGSPLWTYDTVNATIGGGVSGIEQIIVDDQDVENYGAAYVTFDAAYNQAAITVDGSGLSYGDSLIVDTRAQDGDVDGVNEQFTLIGGAFEDYFYMGAHLDSVDSITGNSGWDYVITDGYVTDSAFANVKTVEELDLTTGGATYGFGYDDYVVLGSNAQSSGIQLIRGSDGSDYINTIDDSNNLNIYGNDGNDVIYSGTGSDYVVGGNGNDLIDAGQGNNVVDGGDGNDTVYTGTGDDEIYGQDGNDYISAGSGNNYIDGGAGNDVLYAGNGNDTVIMGTGTDFVDANNGSNEIRVYNIDLDESDTIVGGTGTDTVTLQNNNSHVTAAVNLDNVTGVENYTVVGSGYNADLSFTGGKVDTLNTININATNLNQSNDEFTVTLKAGQTDADFRYEITGGSGADVLVKQNVGVDNDINFQGNLGNDILVINGNDLGSTVTMGGGAGDDSIIVTGGTVTDDGFINVTSVERLAASSKTVIVDTLLNPGELDTVPVVLQAGVTYSFNLGGQSSDTGSLNDPWLKLFDTDGTTQVASNDDVDFPVNYDSAFTFTPSTTGTYYVKVGEFPYPGDGDTGSYRLTISPEAGTPVQLVAQLGYEADRAGIVTIDGGRGNDNVLLDHAFNNTVTVNLNGGDDTFNAINSPATVNFYDTESNITAADKLSGGTGNGDSLNLTADAGVASFNGVTRVENFNVIENGDNNATFNFVDGNFTGIADHINVNASALNDDGYLGDTEGSFVMNAGTVGAGHNFSVIGGTGADTITTGAGADTIDGGADYTYGTASSDVINAGDGNNVVTTHSGDDTITTGSGDDTIHIGLGNNLVNSGAGNDIISNTAPGNNNTIHAGDGVDTITLNDGNNLVYGEGGADLITVGNGNNTISGGDGNDTITVGGTVSSHNLITGGLGGDTIHLGAGSDSVRFVELTDTYGLAASRDTIDNFNQGGTDQILIETNLLGKGVTGLHFIGNATDPEEAQIGIELMKGDGFADAIYDQSTHRLMIDLNDDGVISTSDISMNFTNLAGNALSSLDFQVVDMVAPAAPVLDLLSSDDNGISSSDNLTNDSTSNFWVSIDTVETDGSQVKVGDVVKITGGNGTFTHTVDFGDVFLGGFTQNVKLSEGVNHLNATITDPASNVSDAGKLDVILDTVRPTVSIVVDDAALRDGETTTMHFNFSEAVYNFTSADVTSPSGSLSNWQTIDNAHYTATFTPTAGTTDITNVATIGTAWADLAGNAPSGSTPSSNYTVDTVHPTIVSLGLSDTVLKIGDTATFTAVFSEKVNNVDVSDFTVANGALGTLSTGDGGVTWTGTFTPSVSTEDLTNIITLNHTGSGIVDNADATGNALLVDGSTANYIVDTIAPVVSIATPIAGDNYINDAEDNTVNISGTVVDAEAVDQIVNVRITDSASVYIDTTATVLADHTWATPTIDVSTLANGTLHITADVTDLAGNPAAQAHVDATLDNVHPTVAIGISDTQLKDGDTATVTFTFSENVTGFNLSDVTSESGTLSGFSGSGSVYTATLTPSASTVDATNVIHVGTGLIDIAGNSPVLGTDSGNYTVDTIHPTISSIILSDTALKDGDTAMVTVSFSEQVAGVDVSDFTVASGSFSTAFGTGDGGLTWTATLTPSATTEDTTNIVTLNASGSGIHDFADATGNALLSDASSANYTVDTIHPTVTSLTMSDYALKDGDTATVTVTFSEAVKNVDAGDFTVASGSFTSAFITGDGGVNWTATFTPSAATEDASNLIAINVGNIVDYADATGNALAAGTSTSNFEVDTVHPIATLSTAVYDNVSDTLTIAGTNFNGVVYSAATLDASKIVWDINADGAVTPDYTLTGAVASSTVADGLITINLTTAAANAIEGMTGFTTYIEDGLDISAGVLTDPAGNASTVTASNMLIAYNLTGTSDPDYLSGGSLNDTLSGSYGADTIVGGTWSNTSFAEVMTSPGVGNDTLAGGDGNDVLWGGLGVDNVTGGDQNDTFVVLGSYTAGQASTYNTTGALSNVVGHTVTLNTTSGRATTDAAANGAGEVYDGGNGTDTIHFYGTANITSATVTSIEIPVLHSDLTLTWGQLSSMQQLVLDGNTEHVIHITEYLPTYVSEAAAFDAWLNRAGQQFFMQNTGASTSLTIGGTTYTGEAAITAYTSPHIDESGVPSWDGIVSQNSEGINCGSNSVSRDVNWQNHTYTSIAITQFDAHSAGGSEDRIDFFGGTDNFYDAGSLTSDVDVVSGWVYLLDNDLTPSVGSGSNDEVYTDNSGSDDVFIIGNGDDAILIAANNDSATTCNVYRMYDSDSSANVTAALSLIGTIQISDGNFGDLSSGNFI
jgi:Ca2+-binding RTX toxin-like protein